MNTHYKLLETTTGRQQQAQTSYMRFYILFTLLPAELTHSCEL